MSVKWKKSPNGWIASAGHLHLQATKPVYSNNWTYWVGTAMYSSFPTATEAQLAAEAKAREICRQALKELGE